MHEVRRIVCTACIGWAIGILPMGKVAAQESPVKPRTTADDLLMFSQVLNQIRVNHPDSIKMHELFMAAVEGMVHAADPHSFVIPAVRLDAAKEKEYRAGKLYPVPIRFRFIGADPVVVSVQSGSRAALLDILPGDQLISIEGKPVSANSEVELEITLAGQKNSRIALTFERRRLDGTLVKLTRTPERQKISEVSAVPVATILAQETGYIRLTSFESEKTADDFRDALDRMERNGIDRLILDMRDNGGGRIDQAAAIASEFLAGGAVIYSSAGNRKEFNETIKANGRSSRHRRSYPLIVLVNEGTASAAELVAGALQDHDRALIAGAPTFGKALMMTGFPLADGSLIMLVVGHIKTPCGRVVQRHYRNISRREYYRMAMSDRDTVSRPSCQTSRGRTVYGGGGIYPDSRIESQNTSPAWLARIRETGLLNEWAGGWVDSHRSALSAVDSLQSPTFISTTDLSHFRTFSGQRGIEAPPPEARLTSSSVRPS